MSAQSQLSWFGAKTIYSHDRPSKPCYEERVVVLRAADSDEAIRLAEAEAHHYADPLDGCKFLGYVNVFEMFDGVLAPGAEVFSIMRSVDLCPKEFLDRFYDDGSFHTR